MTLSPVFFFCFALGTCIETQSLFDNAAVMKTISQKVVSIIPKINVYFLCKYSSNAFIMSIEDKTLKNYVTEKIHKAHQIPREAVQQLLK